MQIISTALATAVVPIATIAGGSVGRMVAVIAEAPEWAASILGPMGALGGMVFAIRWLVCRLDRQEAKADERDRERKTDIETLVTINTHTQSVIDQNSKMLADAKFAIEKCMKCEIKHFNRENPPQ